MPTIKFTEKDLNMGKRLPNYSREDLKRVVSDLINKVLQISEVSFKKYARAHGCKPENLQVEWLRYKKILEKNL